MPYMIEHRFFRWVPLVNLANVGNSSANEVENLHYIKCPKLMGIMLEYNIS